ncbi:hypothetical protein N7540_005577 [Penicillium herquei]|nr:hypothetical protein N7540_005577 [Penicillium herquei]
MITGGFNEANEISTEITLQPLIEIKRLPSFDRCLLGVMIMKNPNDASKPIVSQDLKLTSVNAEESPLEKARNVYGVSAFYEKSIISMVLHTDALNPNKAVTTLLFIFICDYDQVSMSLDSEWKTDEQLIKTYTGREAECEWSMNESKCSVIHLGFSLYKDIHKNP